jgi:hypothetical protein
MLVETMRLQWRAARWVLLPFLLLSLGLPLLVLRFVEQLGSQLGPDLDPRAVVAGMSLWAPLFPLLAALLGFAVAFAAWTWDHRTGHVYALTLPLSRARYASYKFLAGAGVLLVPVGCLLAGALLGLLLTPLPELVHAYPLSFTLRFLLGAGITYALGFALAAGTARTVVWLVVGTILLLVFGTILVQFLEGVLRTDLVDPLEVLERALLDWPGPFHVFGGSWMLIDV